MPVVTTLVELQTTNGTTTTLWASPNALTGGFVINIQAHEPVTSDQQFWAIHAGRSDDDNSVISTSLHAQAGDAGGSAWAVEVVNSGDALNVDVTGEASHTIDWTANISYYY